jgi:hypothetical protein
VQDKQLRKNSVGRAPLIFKLWQYMGCVVSSRLRPLYRVLNRGRCSLQGQYGLFGEEKNLLFLPEMKTDFWVVHPIPYSLHLLSYPVDLNEIRNL